MSVQIFKWQIGEIYTEVNIWALSILTALTNKTVLSFSKCLNLRKIRQGSPITSIKGLTERLLDYFSVITHDADT